VEDDEEEADAEDEEEVSGAEVDDTKDPKLF
jgi:hypothetical protein